MFNSIAKELIVSNIEKRGKGDCSTSPVRRVLQIFEKDGTLIAENDTCGSFSVEQIIDFGKYCRQNPSFEVVDLYNTWKDLPIK